MMMSLNPARMSWCCHEVRLRSFACGLTNAPPKAKTHAEMAPHIVVGNPRRWQRIQRIKVIESRESAEHKWSIACALIKALRRSDRTRQFPNIF